MKWRKKRRKSKEEDFTFFLLLFLLLGFFLHLFALLLGKNAVMVFRNVVERADVWVRERHVHGLQTCHWVKGQRAKVELRG